MAGEASSREGRGEGGEGGAEGGEETGPAGDLGQVEQTAAFFIVFYIVCFGIDLIPPNESVGA